MRLPVRSRSWLVSLTLVAFIIAALLPVHASVIAATPEAGVREVERVDPDGWEGWAQRLGEAIASLPDFPEDMDLGSPIFEVVEEVDGSSIVTAYFVVESSSKSSLVAGVGIYESDEAAAADYEEAVGRLARVNHQPAELDDFDEDTACFTYVTNYDTEANCFALRGDALLVTRAWIAGEDRETVLLNATEILRLLDDAVAVTARP